MAFLRDLLLGLSQASNQLPQAMRTRMGLQQQQEAQGRADQQHQQELLWRELQLAMTTRDPNAILAAWNKATQEGVLSPAPEQPAPTTITPESVEVDPRTVIDTGEAGTVTEQRTGPGDPRVAGILMRMGEEDEQARLEREARNRMMGWQEEEAQLRVEELKRKTQQLEKAGWKRLNDSTLWRPNEETGEVELYNVQTNKPRKLHSVDKDSGVLYYDDGTMETVSPEAADAIKEAENRKYQRRATEAYFKHTLKSEHLDKVVDAKQKERLTKMFDEIETQMRKGEITFDDAARKIRIMTEGMPNGKEAGEAYVTALAQFDYDLKLPNMTAEERDSVNNARFIMSSADRILALLDDPEVQDAVGPIRGRLDQWRASLSGSASRNPKVVELRALLDNLHDQAFIRFRSGAAIRDEEIAFYRSLVGDTYDSPEALRTKLETALSVSNQGLQVYYTSKLQEKYGGNVPDRVLEKVDALLYKPKNVRRRGGFSEGLTDEDMEE